MINQAMKENQRLEKLEAKREGSVKPSSLATGSDASLGSGQAVGRFESLPVDAPPCCRTWVTRLTKATSSLTVEQNKMKEVSDELIKKERENMMCLID